MFLSSFFRASFPALPVLYSGWHHSLNGAKAAQLIVFRSEVRAAPTHLHILNPFLLHVDLMSFYETLLYGIMQFPWVIFPWMQSFKVKDSYHWRISWSEPCTVVSTVHAHLYLFGCRGVWRELGLLQDIFWAQVGHMVNMLRALVKGCGIHPINGCIVPIHTRTCSCTEAFYAITILNHS